MKLDKFMWGIIYAITFALLYMVVFLLFPPNAALHVLQTCRTSVQSFFIEFITAPVSYFGVLEHTAKLEILLKQPCIGTNIFLSA